MALVVRGLGSAGGSTDRGINTLVGKDLRANVAVGRARGIDRASKFCGSIKAGG